MQEEQERFAREQAEATEREREPGVAHAAEAAVEAAREAAATREAGAVAERHCERVSALECLRQDSEQERRVLAEVWDERQEMQTLESIFRRRKRDLLEALVSLTQAQRARVEAFNGWGDHRHDVRPRASQQLWAERTA